MKKSKKVSGAWKMPVLAVAAFLIAGGAFAFSSGMVSASGSSLAAVFASWFGRPTLTISRDSNSPSGALTMGSPNQTLAIFDVVARGVTHWATLKHLSGQIAVTAQPTLSLADFVIKYNYCIPPGKTYGYGWAGGNCDIISITPNVQKTASGYSLSFDSWLPIYPEAFPSTLTVFATPSYPYTGALLNSAGDGKVQVSFNGGTASGDQCATIRYGYKNQYGYQGACVLVNVVVGITSAGNVLTVTRPYGYGYKPAKIVPPSVSCTLSAIPASVLKGQPARLVWTTTNATSFSLSSGIGKVSLTGSRQVFVATTTTFIGTATGGGASADCSATLTVIPNIPKK